MSDALAAELAAIRERAELVQKPGIGLEVMLHACVSAQDVPRLLKAVEAMPRLATDWEGRAAETYQTAMRAADRGALPERVEALEARAKTLNDAAVKLRAVITRELTGEDGSDAHD